MSMFDKPMPHLCTDLFDLKTAKLLPSARLFILKDIYRILGPGTISGIYLLGSMAGFQYTKNSDIDINLVLAPGLDRQDIKEYVKEQSYKKLPGTNHEVGYYVQNYTVPKYSEAKYGVYNVIEDRWETDVPTPDEVRDPEEEFKGELEYSKLFLKKYLRSSPKERKDLLRRVRQDRKWAYRFSWGTPRISQQNILYKFLEKNLGIRIEKKSFK